MRRMTTSKGIVQVITPKAAKPPSRPLVPVLGASPPVTCVRYCEHSPYGWPIDIIIMHASFYVHIST